MSILFVHMAAIMQGDLEVVSLLMALCALMAFLITWALNRISVLRIRKGVEKSKEINTLMQHTLDLNNSNVLRLDLLHRYGYNLHGDLLPKEGLGYEESLEFIHPDDRHLYVEFIKPLFYGKAKTNECIFRWDISTRERKGEWRYIKDIGTVEYSDDSRHVPVNIFCTMTDCTEEVLRDKKEQELTEKYRQTFEQSIIGLAFYDKEGYLLTANKKMREILRFQSEEDPYYFNHTIYDMPTFRELLSWQRIEDLYFCTKSVIIERGVNCYTELRIHPIFDENAQLLFITLSIRDVTQDRELYLQNRKNNREMQLANEEIQQYENEVQYLMNSCDLRLWRTSFADKTVTFYKGLTATETVMSFDELINHFVKSVFKEDLLDPENKLKEPKTDLALCHPFFHETESLQWNIIDSVPYHDAEGKQLGTYGIIRNVTPLIEKQQRLKEETERAKDSGRLKSVFMANMTHEIRTPLNSIVGFSDVLPMLTTPEEKQEIVRVIMNNCDMLLRLINDILAISALDAGGIHIEIAETDFAKSFDDICESLQQRIQEPSVEFIKENPYKTFVTHIDNGRIQQVITNFVTNAVKYTHQGHIKVGYRYEDQGLYIYCEDTGEGIPKEAQGKIFDRFVKLNDYIQGTGLGLAICKAIADACKGKIGIISEGKGTGSTFWLWIPCEKLSDEQTTKE